MRTLKVYQCWCNGILTEVRARNKKDAFYKFLCVDKTVENRDIICVDSKNHAIELISKWHDIRLKIRLTGGAVRSILQDEDPMAYLYQECERYKEGNSSRVVSYSQANKILHFFGKDDANYFNKIEVIREKTL